MAELNRSQVSPPGPNCCPALAKMRARAVLGRQAGPGTIDPREIGGGKPHRAGAGRRRSFGLPYELIAGCRAGVIEVDESGCGQVITSEI